LLLIKAIISPLDFSFISKIFSSISIGSLLVFLSQLLIR
jgi:hypothetical protein